MLSAGLCTPSRVLCKGMNLGREGEVKLFYSEVLKSSCTFPCCNFRFVSRKLSSVAGNKDVCLENQAGGFCFQNVSCGACLLCLNLIVLMLSWSVRRSPWPVTGVVLLGGGACFTRSECGYWNPSWVFLECGYCSLSDGRTRGAWVQCRRGTFVVGSAMKRPHSSQRLPLRQTASISPYSTNVQGCGGAFWCLCSLGMGLRSCSSEPCSCDQCPELWLLAPPGWAERRQASQPHQKNIRWENPYITAGIVWGRGISVAVRKEKLLVFILERMLPLVEFACM